MERWRWEYNPIYEVYTTTQCIGVSTSCTGGHHPDGSVGVRFRSTPPHIYASKTNFGSGTKSGAGQWNYGYQWWLASQEEGDFFALGKDGQFLYVNPEADLIIVRLGWSNGGLRSSEWIDMYQAIADVVL